MVLRRIKTAPATLSSMAHGRAQPRTSIARSAEHALVASQEQKRRTGEADAMSEVVTRVSAELEITDSTEQLLLYILARLVIKLDKVEWQSVCLEMSKRLFASFVAHHFMDWMLAHPLVVAQIAPHW